MFEKIVLRRSLDGPGITSGEIADALLFYQNVHIILDYSNLVGLVKSIGMRTILKMLTLPEVKVTYIEEMSGTQTDQASYGPEYSLVAFMITGHQDVGQLTSRKKRLEYMLECNGYKKSEAKLYSERFRRLVNYKRLNDDYYIKGGLITLARSDLSDKEYVDKASRVVAQHLLKNQSLPEGFYFDIIPKGLKFCVETNLDFALISNIQQANIEGGELFTPAHVAAELLNASMGILFAGHYGGDFYTSETESKIIQLRQSYLLHRFHLDRREINNFKELTLNGSPSIADVINQGDRSFEEFLELLSSARKFKQWLKGKSPDESLLASYLEDVTAEGWLSSIPGKLLRYIVGAGVGAVAPVTGLAVSAGDSFFLERLFSGWKPSQFIVNKVKPFVEPNENDG